MKRLLGFLVVLFVALAVASPASAARYKGTIDAVAPSAPARGDTVTVFATTAAPDARLSVICASTLDDMEYTQVFHADQAADAADDAVFTLDWPFDGGRAVCEAVLYVRWPQDRKLDLDRFHFSVTP